MRDGSVYWTNEGSSFDFRSGTQRNAVNVQRKEIAQTVLSDFCSHNPKCIGK